MAAYIPKVSSGPNGYSLNTNVGNYNIDKGIYDRLAIERNAAKGIGDLFNLVPRDAVGNAITSSPEYAAYDSLRNSYTTADNANDTGALSGMFSSDLAPGDDRLIATAALDKQYGEGTSGRIYDAVGLKAQQDSKGKSFGSRYVKPGVKLGIGAGLSLLGGQALGLGTLSGLGASGSALPSSEALLAAPVGTSGTAASSAGGLGSLFSGSAIKGAGIGGISGYLKDGSLSGALKGALTGGATGGISDYISSGANIPGLGSAAETINWNQGGTSVLRPGSGILGSLTRGASSLGLSGGGNSGMLGNLFKVGGGVLDYKKGQDENDELFRRIGEANDRSSAALSPYSQAGTNATNQLSAALAAGFNPQDLQNDAGYQFRLKQGQQGLDRQLAAAGMGQSGAALKAAQEYGQGLASQEYQDAYNRWGSQNKQLQSLSDSGLGAIDAQGNLTRGTAMASAANYATQSNSRRKLLSEVLGGFM
jgi:hypothetical protein